MASSNSLQVQPYLFFNGSCEKAIEFYRRALGASVNMLMRFKDSPDQANCPPGSGDKIMHGSIQIGGTTVLVSDGHCSGQAKFEGFSLSLTTNSEAEAGRFFNALAEGGKIQMPLSKTFFSPSFGMVVDQFGVMWMVYVTPQMN